MKTMMSRLVKKILNRVVRLECGGNERSEATPLCVAPISIAQRRGDAGAEGMWTGSGERRSRLLSSLSSQNKAVPPSLSPHSKWFFQSLETFFAFFPIVGTFLNRFPNYWKCPEGTSSSSGASTADGLVPLWRGLPSPRSLLRGGTTGWKPMLRRELGLRGGPRAGSPWYVGSLKYRTDPFSSISSPLSSPGFLLG